VTSPRPPAGATTAVVRWAGAGARPAPGSRRVRSRTTTPDDHRAASALARGLRAGVEQLAHGCAIPPPTRLGRCTSATATCAFTPTTYARHRTGSRTCSPRSTAIPPASSGANPAPTGPSAPTRLSWGHLPGRAWVHIARRCYQRNERGAPAFRVPLFVWVWLAALGHAGIDLGDRHARADLIDPGVVAQISLGGARQTQDSCGEPAGDDAGKSELLHCGAFFFSASCCSSRGANVAVRTLCRPVVLVACAGLIV
jgi:hypothetical protein